MRELRAVLQTPLKVFQIFILTSFTKENFLALKTTISSTFVWQEVFHWIQSRTFHCTALRCIVFQNNFTVGTNICCSKKIRFRPILLNFSFLMTLKAKCKLPFETYFRHFPQSYQYFLSSFKTYLRPLTKWNLIKHNFLAFLFQVYYFLIGQSCSLS